MANVKIAINQANAAAIAALINQENGSRPGKYTINLFSEIDDLVREAEKTLNSISLAKTNWKGTQINYTSGEEMPSSYKSSRKANSVTIERGNKEWFLTSFNVVSISIYGGKYELKLSTINKNKVFSAFEKLHRLI